MVCHDETICSRLNTANTKTQRHTSNCNCPNKNSITKCMTDKKINTTYHSHLMVIVYHPMRTVTYRSHLLAMHCCFFWLSPLWRPLIGISRKERKERKKLLFFLGWKSNPTLAHSLPFYFGGFFIGIIFLI